MKDSDDRSERIADFIESIDGMRKALDEAQARVEAGGQAAVVISVAVVEEDEQVAFDADKPFKAKGTVGRAVECHSAVTNSCMKGIDHVTYEIRRDMAMQAALDLGIPRNVFEKMEELARAVSEHVEGDDIRIELPGSDEES